MLPDIDRRNLLKAVGVAGIASTLSTSASAESTNPRSLPDRRGPIRKSRFSVQIEDVQVPGWFRVELPAQRLATTEYREGHEPEQDRQLWGRTEYDDLTMVRGVEPATAGNSVIPGEGAPAGMKLFDWFKKARQGKLAEARKKVTVQVFNESGPQGAPVAKWVFEKAWPKEYSPPDLDASARGEIAMEELTLDYYKYDRKSP